MKKKMVVYQYFFCSTVKKNLLLLLVICLFVTGFRAQIQYNQWAFGRNASHDFITGNPLTTAPLINSMQDAASWCDGSGNLLFYTDGKNIYNAFIPTTCTACLNGNPNGGGGTQGVLILPRIGGSSDEFYIFTVSDRGGLGSSNINNGLSYYIYNVSTNALSSVTSMGTSPGTTGSFTTEGLTAIPHSNGVDYWIVVKAITTTTSWIGSALPPNQPAGANNNSIYAYLVTAAGVAANPVVSDGNYSVAIAGANPGENSMNEIKCSPDRQFVCITNRMTSTTGNTNLYRFNSLNGNFEFLQFLPMLAGYAPFGSSFSPNSRVLYVCGSYPTVVPGPIPGNQVLRQYDLTNLTCNLYTTPPFCDFFTPGTLPASLSSQLQLTPDGRIFRTRHSSGNVDVIFTPNNIGCSNIGYQANFIDVSTIDTNQCRLGFPNNIDAQPGAVLTTEWPKTTNTTSIADNGVALESDQFDDVYSAGVYKQSTKFETLTLLPGIGTQNVYLAKYDNCEGLKWVANGISLTSFSSVSCNSMSIEPTINKVFFTGRFSGQVQFYNATSPTGSVSCSSGSVSISGSGIYVAIYDYNGCLLGVNTIPDNASFTHNSGHIRAVRVNVPGVGWQYRVYVAVNETPSTGDERIRIYAFIHTGSATLTSAWIAPFRCSSGSLVNDISSSGTMVSITGTYYQKIFWNTSVSPFASTPIGVPEAFVGTIRDVNNLALPNFDATLSIGFDPTALGASQSSGRGISCRSNTVFLTGTYTGTTSNAFGMGVPMAGNASFSCGYAACLSSTGTPPNWARSISSDGNTVGFDVTLGSSGTVYLTGTWTDSRFYIDNIQLPTTVPMKNHIYVVKMLVDGTYNSPLCWQNHSYMASDVTEVMKPARIISGSNYVYVNGFYKGIGQMEDDIAFNSPLTSTTNKENSFVWRYSVSNGISLKEGTMEEDKIFSETSLFQPKIFPNPARTSLTVQANTIGGNMFIEILNAAGQQMKKINTSASLEQIDVSQWATGIYFVRIVVGDEMKVEKFIKE